MSNDITKAIVKITYNDEERGITEQGTGIIVSLSDTKRDAILTVYHVINGFDGHNEQIKIESDYEEEFKILEVLHNKSDDKDLDVAVIYIEKLKWFLKEDNMILPKDISLEINNYDVRLAGFPSLIEQEGLDLSYLPIHVIVENYKCPRVMLSLKHQFGTGRECFEDEVAGMSGGPLYCEIDNKMYLLGVTKKIPVNKDGEAIYYIFHVWHIGWYLEKIKELYGRDISLSKNLAPIRNNTNSIDSFINNMKRHTENLLRRIEENIYYKGNVLHFNDELYQEQVKLNSLFCRQIVIISGEGGVGKTSFIKHWINDVFPILFSWKAVEFGVNKIKDMFRDYGNYTGYDFFDYFEDVLEKHILIDSAEALFDLEDNSVFEQFFNEAIHRGWKVIFTVRTAFTENLKYLLRGIYSGAQMKEICMPVVIQEQIEKILADCGVAIPQNRRITKLIGIPFYLNEYLKIADQNDETRSTVKEFKEELWRAKILGYPNVKNRINTRRKKMIFQLSRLKSESQMFFVREDKIIQEDHEALSVLISDGILDYDEKQGYFFTHDIYEEWSLEHMIEDCFNEYANDFRSFFNNLIPSISMRRVFRQWIIMNIEENRQDVKNLLNQIIENGGIDRFWIDETYISILESQYCYEFYKEYKAKCIESNSILLYRMVFLLRTAVKKSYGNLIFTIPNGYGWGATILFLSENWEDIIIAEEQMHIIMEFLLDWVRIYSTGGITRLAAMIACSIYEKRTIMHAVEDKLISIILAGAAEIGDKIEAFFSETINDSDKYDELFENALTSLKGVNLAKSNAKLTMKIAKYFWLNINKDMYDYDDSWEASFGINSDYCFEYNITSAYQTPIYWLLKVRKQETLDFILEVINITIEKFITSNHLHKYEDDYTKIRIRVDDDFVVQHCSMRIWQMYRGTQTGPGLIQCLMAALEKWLIEEAEKETVEEYENLLKYLIINSKSASITAVVVSAIIANPNKSYRIALMFIETKGIFIQDRMRVSEEKSLAQMIGIHALSARIETKIYIKERMETLKEKFRNNTLDFTVLNYQVAPIENLDEKHRKEFIANIYEKIDDELKNIKEKNNEEESNNEWELYLSQMDLRKMQAEQVKIEGNDYVTLQPVLSESVQKMIKENEEKMEPVARLMKLRLWSESRLERNESSYNKLTDYENNSKTAYIEMLNLPKVTQEHTDITWIALGLNYTISCVLLRDFQSNLLPDEIKFCEAILIKGAYELCKSPNQVFMIGVGFEAILEGLIVMLQQEDERYNEIRYIITYILIVKGRDFQEKIIEKISKLESKNILYFIRISLCLADMYDNEVVQRYGESFDKLNIDFWKQNETLINTLSDKEYNIEMDVISKCSIETLSNTLAMVPSNTQDSLLLDIVEQVIYAFGAKMKIEQKGADNFEFIWGIWEKISEFILHRTCTEIPNYMNIINPILKKDEWTHRFLNFLIKKEDLYKNSDAFWKTWDELYHKIIAIVNSEKEHQMNEETDSRCIVYVGEHECEAILTEYMLASYIWKEETKEWHSLSYEQHNFYKKISLDLGFHKATLHGIIHVLNSVGSCFFEYGVDWISEIIKNNPWLERQNLMINTMVYLEKYMIDITNRWQSKIKTDTATKEKIICILNFMVEQGSTVGFMLRDEL